MYNIINHSEIYIYDCYKNCIIKEFPTLKDCLKYCAERSIAHPYMMCNYLDCINMGKDTYIYYEDHYYFDSDGNTHYYKENLGSYKRQYIFYDYYGRIIDPRIYKKEIQSYIDDKDLDCNFVSYIKEQYGTIRKRPYDTIANKKEKQKRYNQLPEFRKNPVPRTGRGSRGNYYRHFKTTNELRQNSDPEIKKYVRPCRLAEYNMNPYDNERIRPQYKSWKHCTKKRKQWM